MICLVPLTARILRLPRVSPPSSFEGEGNIDFLLAKRT
ncbi:hypothetical protein TSAR_005971 [Trichomalopsis sarcophagae]|uniref:Uncharacterized protein n=1 Tax=Trichomalopsis sarcophagae TaxID=543379 RepID=A0A232EVZ0_9HYME|nr:hypothetical protein TSAR_005971 [Trichomalopsis sarcophagae]